MGMSRVVVEAGQARLVEASAGQRVVVEDLHGGQVGDLFAFVADDPGEHLSAAHTRAALRRLFPSVGESFFSSARRPILTLEEDTSPGVHDLLIAACDPERYRQLGVDGDHRSCATNLREALAPLGVDVPIVPQPVNVFMNTPPRADGSIDYGESLSAAGDHLVLRADLDVLVVLSACPMDVIAISRGGPGPLAIGVID